MFKNLELIVDVGNVSYEYLSPGLFLYHGKDAVL